MAEGCKICPDYLLNPHWAFAPIDKSDNSVASYSCGYWV